MSASTLYWCRRESCIDVGENLACVSGRILYLCRWTSCVYRRKFCICVGEHLMPVSDRILYLFGENSVCVRVCRLASCINLACVLLCLGECGVSEIILYVRQAPIICQWASCLCVGWNVCVEEHLLCPIHILYTVFSQDGLFKWWLGNWFKPRFFFKMAVYNFLYIVIYERSCIYNVCVSRCIDFVSFYVFYWILKMFWQCCIVCFSLYRSSISNRFRFWLHVSHDKWFTM